MVTMGRHVGVYNEPCGRHSYIISWNKRINDVATRLAASLHVFWNMTFPFRFDEPNAGMLRVYTK